MIARLRGARLPGTEVLAIPAFRRFISAELLLDFSSNLRLAAQSWVIVDLGGSALWVGFAAGARGLPAVLFGLIGGLVADRFDPRRVLLAGWVVHAATAAFMAVLLMAGALELWHIVALAAVTGTIIAFTLPSAYAFVAQLVPSERLSNGLAMTSLSWSLMEMTAPAVAGAVLALAGKPAVFWLMTGGFLSAAAVLVSVRRATTRPAQTRGPALAALVEGIQYVRRTPPLPLMALLAFEQNLMAVAIMPLIPVYAKEVLKVGPTGYGLLAGAMGTGFLCSTLAISFFGNFKRRGLTMLVSGAFWDGGAVAFGFSNSLPLSMGILFVIGLSGPFWFNAAITTFQSKATDAVRGRVMSVWAVASEMFPVGWFVGGVMATAFGYREALIISALCGTPVALAFFLFSPAFRRN